MDLANGSRMEMKLKTNEGVHKMKKTGLMMTGIIGLTGFIALAMPTQAHADGFVCDTMNDARLRVKIYNHVDAEDGTRNPAIMILSDRTVQEGRKTIAKFTSETERLTRDGATYVADVDLRYGNSNRKGELILGTKLGHVDTIQVDVDFTYGRPVSNGEKLLGEIVVLKRDGDKNFDVLECTRYLKN